MLFELKKNWSYPGWIKFKTTKQGFYNYSRKLRRRY